MPPLLDNLENEIENNAFAQSQDNPLPPIFFTPSRHNSLTLEPFCLEPLYGDVKERHFSMELSSDHKSIVMPISIEEEVYCPEAAVSGMEIELPSALTLKEHLSNDSPYRDTKDESESNETPAVPRQKTNHTWEETARQLQLCVCIPEMSMYDIPNQWLSANDYFDLLTAMENGASKYPFYDLGYDSHCVSYHPPFIYSNPCPSIYFLRCEHLKNGTPKFGFPRIKNVTKEYTWKKQGFTTAIPKRCPCVRYITANCYLCGKGRNRNNIFAAFSGREPVLRMHAVMKIQSFFTRGNTEKYQNDNYIDQGPYVLIHILKGGSHASS